MNKRELSQLERVTSKQLDEVKITPFWLMINSEYGIGITSHNSIRFNRNCMKRLIDIFNTESEKTNPATNTEEPKAIMKTKEEPKELAQESSETAKATPAAENKESRRGKRGKQKKPVKVPFLLKAEPEIMAKIEELAESSEQSKTAIIEKALNIFFAESEKQPIFNNPESVALAMESETPLPKVKKSPEQTTAFSYEELQEQAKLIEKLTTQNAHLSAELQILKTKFEQEKQLLEINVRTGQNLRNQISKLESEKIEQQKEIIKLKKSKVLKINDASLFRFKEHAERLEINDLNTAFDAMIDHSYLTWLDKNKDK